MSQSKKFCKPLIFLLLTLTLTACGGTSTSTHLSCLDESSEDDPIDSLPIGELEPVEEAPQVWAEEQFAVAVERNIVYGQGLSHSVWASANVSPMDLLLDVYTPVNAPGNRPAVLLIHGGSFAEGSKDREDIVEMAEYLTKRGFVAIAINYRLARHKGTLPDNWMDMSKLLFFVPTQMKNQMRAMYPASRDAKAAMRWLHTHAEDLDVNPEFIAAYGVSAGAQLAVMLGVTLEADFRDELSVDLDPTLHSTHLEARADVSAAVDFWGSGLIVDFLNFGWKVNRWQAGVSPLLMVHGTLDVTVPYFEAIRTRNSYCRTGSEFQLHTLHGVGHDVWGSLIYGQSLMQVTHDFVARVQNLEVL